MGTGASLVSLRHPNACNGHAGTDVLLGLMGYGVHSRLHTCRIERLSEDLPIILEIVDTREKLEVFLTVIDPAISEGLATLEKAYVHFYRYGSPRGQVAAWPPVADVFEALRWCRPGERVLCVLRPKVAVPLKCGVGVATEPLSL